MINNIIEQNNILFEKLGLLLNLNSSAITEKSVKAMIERTGMRENEAVEFLVADYLGLDIVDSSDDKLLFNKYVKNMIKKQDKNIFLANPYYQNIHFDTLQKGDIKFGREKYNPYELFVYDDIEKMEDGRLIPKVGYFDTEFLYPAIYEKGVLWMSVTPNEVNTMRDPIENAFGSVLTFGLGLGYFAYMVSLKQSVSKVTIVESNPTTIELFKNYILPQFKYSGKIEIINDDAFTFAENNYKSGRYDYVFADIWRDAGDGLDCYLKFKELEKLNKSLYYDYWIEKTIKCYLD